jgi:23S rRNA G2445 N2-methylase RlmL
MYELEVIPGLEQFTVDLLKAWHSAAVVLHVGKGRILFTTQSPLPSAPLSAAVAIYQVLTLPVPRPKALLGHQHWRTLMQIVTQAAQNIRPQTVSIGAAGKDTAVMQRILSQLADELRLEPVEKGDLHLRLRPSLLAEDHWDVLIRLTIRPWATRAWRTHNMPGALSGPVAAAIAAMAKPQPSQRVLNSGVGSGTLLIEAALKAPLAAFYGLDNDPDALTICEDHCAAASVTQHSLLLADATLLPFPSATFDHIVCDLPFGQLVGDRPTIEIAYPRWIAESARVLRSGGQMIAITHSIRLLEKVLAEQTRLWHTQAVFPITLNGLHPRIYVLQRR